MQPPDARRPSRKLTALRYGIAARTATYWNLYVAREAGFFGAEGLVVEAVPTGGTLETIEALLEGRIELAGCSPDELIGAVQRGADLVVIGGIIGRPVSWIIGRRGMTTLVELRGGRIGVNQTRGSVSMVLRAALRAAGLGEKDYQQVRIGNTPAMVEGLRRGDVDAAMLTAPFDGALVREGFAALLNVGEQFPCYAFTTINARRGWVQEHPAELAAFFRATSLAGDALLDPARRDENLRALAAGTGLGGPVLSDTYAVYLGPGVLSRRGEVEPAAIDAVARLMAEEGLLAGPAPPMSQLLLPCWTAGD